jgi:hypothetical protein
MSGRPVHADGPGYVEFWDVIREQQGIFTVREIWLQVEGGNHHATATRAIQNYAQRLVKAGYLSMQPASGPGQPNLYKVIRKSLEAPRLRPDGSVVVAGQKRDHMWRTMKMLRDFAAADLAISASTEGVKVVEADASEYIRALHRAGYLVQVKPPKTAVSQGRYRLLASKNTGPRAPMVQRVKQVFDPNLREVVWRGGIDA